MLRIRNLDVSYGRIAALRRVSLHVRAGEIVAIVGANGAGKTTLLKAVSGLVRPRDGEIALQGRSIAQARTEDTVAMGCSLVPEGRQVFAELTVRENLVATAANRMGRKCMANAARRMKITPIVPGTTAPGWLNSR